MTVFRCALGLVFLLALGACASLTEEQCLAGNWEAIGQSDGAAGRSTDVLAAHQSACAEVGITPDPARWSQGRALGLQQYCTLERAYALGRQGRAIAPVCSTQARLAMAPAHAEGLKYHELTLRIKDLRNRRALLIDELEDLVEHAGTDRARQRARELRRRIRLLDQRLRRLERRRLASDF